MPKINVDGIDLNYRIVGDGPETVLCLPGFLGNIEADFGKFFEKVDTTKFRWVSWDPPGYGESYPPPRAIAFGFLDQDAVLVGKMMKALGIEKYHVFGWSQGGATGIFLAKEKANCVLKLVTLGAEAIIDEMSVKFYTGVNKIEFWPQDKLSAQLKYCKREDLQRTTRDMLTVATQLHQLAKGEFMKNVVKAVKCPVLIIHGDHDTTISVENASILHSRIPQSEMMLFPGGNHDAHLTHTEEFLRILENFLLSK